MKLVLIQWDSQGRVVHRSTVRGTTCHVGKDVYLDGRWLPVGGVDRVTIDGITSELVREK